LIIEIIVENIRK